MTRVFRVVGLMDACPDIGLLEVLLLLVCPTFAFSGNSWPDLLFLLSGISGRVRRLVSGVVVLFLAFDPNTYSMGCP